MLSHDDVAARNKNAVHAATGDRQLQRHVLQRKNLIKRLSGCVTTTASLDQHAVDSHAYLGVVLKRITLLF